MHEDRRRQKQTVSLADEVCDVSRGITQLEETYSRSAHTKSLAVWYVAVSLRKEPSILDDGAHGQDKLRVRCYKA